MEEVIRYMCFGIVLIWVIINVSWLVHTVHRNVVDPEMDKIVVLWPILIIPAVILIIPVVIMIVYLEVQDRRRRMR